VIRAHDSKMESIWQRNQNRAATGRERYHERRPSVSQGTDSLTVAVRLHPRKAPHLWRVPESIRLLDSGSRILSLNAIQERSGVGFATLERVFIGQAALGARIGVADAVQAFER
jgi:hypothetical protein